MATYKIKQEYEKTAADAVATFASPIEGIGFHLKFSEATQAQLEKMYLLQHPFVEKVETSKTKGE